MELLSIAKQRFSMCSYTDQHVEPEKLEKVLETARVVPTTTSLQSIRLIVAQSEQSLAKIGKATNVYGAPLAIIIYANHERAWVRLFNKKQIGDIDASTLTNHMMLQATEPGLGSVWVYYFNPDILCRESELSGYLEPVNVLAIGHSNVGIANISRLDRQRIAPNQLVTYEK